MLPNCWLASLDLEDAYFLVSIHKSHRKYLRFNWRGIIYEFAALPFGLSIAPYIFTKIVRPVVAHLRERGFQSIVYLDDLLLIGLTRGRCEKNVFETIKLLTSLGFLINYEKSNLEPATVCKFLGFNFHSIDQAINIPKSRREKLLTLLCDISKKSTIQIRDFASFIGSIVSVCPAVKYGFLHTKQFERQKFLALIKSGNYYSAKMNLPSDLIEDFAWWKNTLSNSEQKNFILSGNFVREIFLDASLSGWGASCGNRKTHGWWSQKDKTEHINVLELKAAYNSILCFANDVENSEFY